MPLAGTSYALRPVSTLAVGFLACGLVAPASADIDHDKKTQRMLVLEERAVEDALLNRSGHNLRRAANKTGRLVDQAQFNAGPGIGASDCDLAAMSLTNIALLAAKALNVDISRKSVFLQPAKNQAKLFSSDMRRCENALRLSPTIRKPLAVLLGKI
jgi:hypothetical protein